MKASPELRAKLKERSKLGGERAKQKAQELAELVALAADQGDDPEILLQSYQTLAAKQLPIPKRVQLYARIARKVAKNPFAALKAVERLDELSGIVTRKEQKEQERERLPIPLFQLPAGTTVSFEIPAPQDVVDAQLLPDKASKTQG